MPFQKLFNLGACTNNSKLNQEAIKSPTAHILEWPTLFSLGLLDMSAGNLKWVHRLATSC